MSKVKDARLGVNIDHVATLRQARGEDYPSLVEAARVSLENGADQITIHLREDRRHIQDTDVPAIMLVTKRFGVPLNLELAANQEILNIAVDTAPEWVCIVPEKREERTTEGGLNMNSNEQFENIKAACAFLKSKNPNGKISLFVEANLDILERCVECSIDAVEIHTGDYARDFLAEEDIQKYLVQFKNGYEYLKDKNIAFHAGHGLTDESLVPLVEQGLFAEYNIGHWIICDSVFNGLGSSIKKLKNILSK